MTTETSIYEYAKQGLIMSADETALWFYGRAMTYRELFSCIDHAADHLSGLGVKEGSVVTIHLPNCPQAAIAVYATAKLGGVCNMVHPQVPFKVLQDNMAFVESAILITGDHFDQAHLFDGSGKAVVYTKLSEYMGFPYNFLYRLKNHNKAPKDMVPFKTLTAPASVKADIPNQEALAESCVAYLHSSGTTGVPKTVMHSHAVFNRWVENSKSFFKNEGLQQQSVLAVAPFFHGSGLVIDLHRVLSGGGTQTLIAQWNPKQAIKFIKKNRITILTGVPAIYRSLLKYKSFSGAEVSSISQCFISGDRVPAELRAEFNERVGRSVLFEAYGMTEIVTACFANSAEHDNPAASGYPLENCFAAVLDEKGEPRLVGEGEILVSTNTHMLGYLKDTEASDKLYIDFDGKKWLRTGDIGAVDEEGYVYFKDRIKHVIVRNGFNVFPFEVENIIRAVPGVADVCVLGLHDERLKTEKIVAFIECTEDCDKGSVVSCVDLTCKESLPKFSMPNEIHMVDSFPRNRMRKIDRAGLKEIYEEQYT